MKLHIDKETKRITGYTLIGNPVDSKCDFVEVDMAEDDVTEDLFYSTFENGKIVLDEAFKTAAVTEDTLRDIRMRRESECFPIINRGQLWYNNLTEEQTQELNQWYKAWLDAPDTLVTPEKPSWLQ